MAQTGLCGAGMMVGEAGPRSRNGGCDRHYLCERFRAEPASRAKASSFFLLVLSPYLCSHPAWCTHTHTLAQMHTHPPTYMSISTGPRLSLSSSCRSFFLLELSSAALLPFGKESGQRATWLWALVTFPVSGCETVYSGKSLEGNCYLSLGRRSLLPVWGIG